MWQTRYPLARIGAHGNGLRADGPIIAAGNAWQAMMALREWEIELPRTDDTCLIDGADGLTVYVASVSDGRWYAALTEV